MTGDVWKVDDLLNCAGVARENWDIARRLLENVLSRPHETTTPLGYGLARFLNPDLGARDDDKLLDDLAKSAEALLGRLARLRAHPYQHMTFWGADMFGSMETGRMMRKLDATLPIETPTGLENDDVIQMLHGIVSVARATKQNRPAHRPKRLQKQFLIDRLAEFWSTFSPHPLTAEKEGKFHAFAEACHEVASGKEESVERAVRDAVKRIKPLEQNPFIFL